MRILIWLLLAALNFYILFVLSKKFDRPLLLKVFPALVPIVLIVWLLIGFVMWLMHVHLSLNSRELFISIVMSIVIILLNNFANQVFLFMVDSIINFHQKNNINNISKQPIKFIIVNQSNIKAAATTLWFLGSVLMLYGIWLGK